MRIGRTVHRCKCKYFALIQLYRLTRCQIICCNDRRLVCLLDSLADSAEDIQHTLRNILYVRCTSLHICIIHCRKHLRKIVSCRCYCKLCIDFLRTDDIFDRLNIIQVFQHHLMNLKNHSVGFSDIGNRFFVQFF